MLWNPAKRHDKCENCFLGHPVSFNFVMPIELFSKRLYPSTLHPFVMWLPWQSSWLSRKASSIKVHWLATLKAFSRLQHLLMPVLSWAWTVMSRDLQRGLCSGMFDWSWFFPPCFFFTLDGPLIFLVSWNTEVIFLLITRLLFQQILCRGEVSRKSLFLCTSLQCVCAIVWLEKISV